MQEVYQMISRIILLGGLFYFAWTDFQTKRIKVRDLLVLAVLGLIIKILSLFCQKEQNFLEICKTEFLLNLPEAMLVGGVLFLIAKITREQVGIGDAFVFCVTGIFLDFVQNLTLLIGTFLLVGMLSLVWLIRKKKGKHDSIAMMPFTLAAYVVFIL